MTMNNMAKLGSIAALILVMAPPAVAKNEPPELVTCDSSIGTIALIEGSNAGWTEWNLNSPRPLLNQLALQSGCFTPRSPASQEPADFLVTAIAGTQEEIDQSMEVAKGAATEALLRSGAASSVLGRVPFAGSVLGMFGGFGGKKKTFAAGLQVVSPATGQTVAAGKGAVSKSQIKFKKAQYSWAADAAGASGYNSNKDGRKLAEAFIIAFNQVVSQRELIEAAAVSAPAPEAEEPRAVVAIDTVMRSGAAADANEVRSLRAGTELNPTGNREGLFIEVADNYGTTGWVSVEDLQ